MKEYEVKIEEITAAANKYIENLKEELHQLQNQMDRFDWSRSIPKEEAQKKAEETYLRYNNLLKPERDLIKTKKFECNEELNKIEQGSKLEKAFNYFRSRSLERTLAYLNQLEIYIEQRERAALESNEAKIFIKDYSQQILKSDPVFREYLELGREKYQVETKLDQLLKLQENISETKPGKTIKYSGRIDDLDTFLSQVPLINRQLNENTVSIRELEEAVNYHLKKIGKMGETDSEYQQTVNEIFKLSKKVMEQFTNIQEEKILRKEEELSKIQYYEGNGIINYDVSLKAKSLQQEIANDKQELLKFKMKASKAFNDGKWEELPAELRALVIETPEYRELRKQLSQLNNERQALERLSMLASMITNKDQDIKVSGFYLNRSSIVKDQKFIAEQLNEFSNHKINQFSWDK